MHRIEETDSPVYVGRGAWHRLGTVVPYGTGAREGAEEALPWDVLTQPATYYNPIECEHREAPGQVVLRRDHADSKVTPLAVVGPTWKPFLNAELIDLGERLERLGFSLDSVGSHSGGRKVWLLLETGPDASWEVGGSEHRAYLAVLNAHGGTSVGDGSALALVETDVRVVCANTYAMVDAETKKRGVRIPHRAGIAAAADRIVTIAEESAKGREEYRSALRALAGKTVGIDFAGLWEGMLEPIAPALPADKLDPDYAAIQDSRATFISRSLGALEEIHESPTLDGCRGTALGVFESFTEWLDSGRSARGAGQLSRLGFSGPNAVVKSRALDVAVGAL